MFRSIRSLSSTNRVYSSFKHATTRNTIADIYSMYHQKVPISMVTSHDFITAKFAEQAQIDINLIGDSLAMVALGYDDTNEVSFDEFLYHVRSVSRGNSKSLLIADLPFGSYEISADQALETSIKMVKSGRVQGIKLEGGLEVAPVVSKIVAAGIPVIGHVGLTPQRHNTLSGFKLQGATTESAMNIYKDCLALQKAGAFAVVLECIPNKLASLITENLNIPTIGIGAGPGCSGHVLVMADMLGMNGPSNAPKSKFVKEYANLYETAVEGLQQYKADLISQSYPDPEVHGYKMKKEVLAQVKQYIKS
ncbi:cell wall biogenesis and architecture protein [Yamadazyma tenuis]|uniref:3-methyl-2-oxobutanoate hydroxymethyltransferase n=1 Tax=Candida tenuis (strain ATCC 10573 / BCRC 21748 / CBS 615 / JCM 9827 / NBRC 10315 / NRRL Y-1498 / VKM Y-70) TaxID=590646 RepID=G3AZ68_CANTC|nr:ketopantoate hydroxymethyltransferase [Yamadazyma tenuis ATCC 10573]EGV66021.1 ketopantoate hydroxymethyltransferase [Yamadazyma tenuis ATCC 10573]WEJ95640.1 cell wall biogenesis and architecture protein [Yamadazyma tenuis]